jgi:hypothetical protein
MFRKKIDIVIYRALSALFVIVSGTASAQLLHAGLKAGANISWVRPDESEFRDQVNIAPIPGFNAGAVFSFKMKDRFFLHTEILYSTKGRQTKGELGLDEKVVYNYIDLPLTYNIYFKAHLKMKHIRHFRWYTGIGPNFGYWLGGKGTIKHYELTEFDVSELKYKVKFGERPEEDMGKTDIVYVKDANRFQLGVNIGGGILLEPINGSKIMLDARFELGHTWLGTPESADYVIPVSYTDNLKTRNMGLRFSLMYLLETNLDKKVRNKGKSTLKHRQ